MLFLLIGLLAGCATTPPVAEQSVEERAQARWNHLVTRDFDEAWTYYSPGFRETTSVRAFDRDMHRRTIRWLEAQVRSATCEGDRCNVSVAVTYQALAAPAGQGRMRVTRNLDETWIRLDDQWWFVQN
ncbi:MAG: hypothetical protein ACNA7J_10115 [Wenzhouxiangella sp.]